MKTIEWAIGYNGKTIRKLDVKKFKEGKEYGNCMNNRKMNLR